MEDQPIMRFLHGLVRFCGITVPAFLTGLLVVVVVADVLSRNVFAKSLHWAHDLAVILLAATVWLGLAGAARMDQLFGIRIVIDRLPPLARRVAVIIGDLGVILIALQIIRAAWAQISTAKFTKFLSLGWPKWIIAALLLAGMVLVIVNCILDLIRNLPEGRS